MRLLTLIATALFCSTAYSQGQFQPPRAKIQFAPDRTCDLTDLSVDIDVDYEKRTITGSVTNTFVPLRAGLKSILLHAGPPIEILAVTANGNKVTFKRAERDLIVDVPNMQKGKEVKVVVRYRSNNARGTGFGSGGGGWHWISPNATNKDRVGFWTQGETRYNSDWVPTWDYPNDLATSTTRTTVPADWGLIGNGELVSETTKNGRKTAVWRMTKPHATYLLAIYGGLFDIKKDSWSGIDLWYVVPKGSGYLIDSSFGHTKDMLAFFSERLGVKYPWNKYAQCAMYDFGGGMENVTATNLGEGSLTEPRDGYYLMDSLNSHELGHQWFGDLVTCKDWGDTWLNESFATFMESIYMEHSRGANAYAHEVENNTQAYLQEARRYKRPISTRLYSDPDDMFDSHSYPKGGVVLHTLRRWLGDENFFAGLKKYLETWKHTPVESTQLRRIMTETTGINCDRFWAQWIEKPGHPVLEYTWAYAGGKLQLTVKQLQDTKDGTPVYETECKVGVFQGTSMDVKTVMLSKASETFEITTNQPSAVVLDPFQDFLREIPKYNWTETELPVIFAHAPNASDRERALGLMLGGTSIDYTLMAKVLAADNGISPAFDSLNQLANKAEPTLRTFWLSELGHKNYQRRATAVQALAKLPPDPGTVKALRAQITDTSPIQVVINAINALKAWDAKGNRDVFELAAKFKDRRSRIKRAAESALK